MFSFCSSVVGEMRKKEVIEFCDDCVRCNKPVCLCGAIYHGASLSPDLPLISLCLYCFLCYTDISKLLIVHQNPLSLSKRSTLQQVISNKLKKQQTATFTHFTLWRILNDTIIGIMNPVVIMNILHPLSSLDVIRRNPSFWEAVGSRCKCI